MLFTYAINNFSMPATANKPLVAFKAGTGEPARLVRIDIASRATALAARIFRLRLVDVTETGGTAVNATALDSDYVRAVLLVVKKGTFGVDPTLIAAGTAGAGVGLITFDALGYLP